MHGPPAGSPSDMAASCIPANELDAATALLQSLIQIDTTNPPGDERAAMDLVAKACRDMGLHPELVGTHAERPNVVAKWSADPAKLCHRPLILSCHLDVVPAVAERWSHPPFSGHNDGNHIWGRGAIDMKGFAAMGLAALFRLREEELPINRDVIFAAVCDEEAGTRHGSEWLVDKRPELLGGDPEYVINEVGGFTVHQKGRRFYPVQVAEKGVAWLRLSVKGKPGHSSMPTQDNSVVKLAKAVAAIGSSRLPWHPSKPTRTFIDGFAKPDSWITQKLSPLLLNPAIGPHFLTLAVSDASRRASLEALLRNTATPTCLQASHAINTLPGCASVDIDGRLAPGQTAESLISELSHVIRPLIGDSFEFEILKQSPAVEFSTDTPLYRSIEKALKEADPEAHVVPSIIPGFTDSRNYERLGAQCYGFYPLQLPPELDFAALFHGDDERIPISGFHWGINTLTNLLRSFLTT